MVTDARWTSHLPYSHNTPILGPLPRSRMREVLMDTRIICRTRASHVAIALRRIGMRLGVQSAGEPAIRRLTGESTELTRT